MARSRRKPDIPAEEVAGVAQGGRPRSAAAKIKRDAQIVRLRAQGHSWDQIGKAVRIDHENARKAYYEYVEHFGEKDIPRARLLVKDFLLRLQGVMERYITIAETTKNDSVKLGAIKGYAEALAQEFHVLQSVGAIPLDLGTLKIEADIHHLTATIIRVLNEHSVPTEVMRDIRAAVAETDDDAALN